MKQVINAIASKRDIKNLRCSFLLILEHPEVIQKTSELYGPETHKEMYDHYNITIKAESEKSKSKKDNIKKVRIEALRILGFSNQDAEKLSELTIEELKTLGYSEEV